MPTLTIQPIGGLANRLRALLSAKSLAEKYDYKLRVNWIRHPELNCRFEDLFLPIPDVEFFEDKEISQILRTSFVKSRKYKLLNYIHNRTKFGIDIFFNNDMNAPEELRAISRHLKKKRNIYIQTCETFSDNFKDLVPLLRPIGKIASQVENKVGEFAPVTFGLHIRRTDNGHSIDQSPDVKFEKIIEENPQALFYLSTDDESVERKFREKYGNRIIVSEKEFTRDSTKGIQDALVDMLCLGKTQKIYGSFYSSFSEWASHFGNIPLEIAK